MDYLQKQKRLDFSDYSETEYEHMSNDDIELENKILHDVQLTQLEQAFEYLNAEEKIILMMRYQDSMAVKEIAETLSIGESAVKMRLKRSRDRLANILTELEHNTKKIKR
jgi:RNA polymerase sigma-70 factor (ECF subfamily)